MLAAVAAWLVCLAAMIATQKRRAQTAFTIASVVVAAVAFILAPAERVAPAAAAVQASSGKGCVEVHEGMNILAVRRVAGDPLSIVGEEDTQGPGSQALVYPGCIVHLLDGRVRMV